MKGKLEADDLNNPPQLILEFKLEMLKEEQLELEDEFLKAFERRQAGRDKIENLVSFLLQPFLNK
jgi:hypothetical protein